MHTHSSTHQHTNTHTHRLASGDSAGTVVLWDVLNAMIVGCLDDVPAAASILDAYADAARSDCAVQGMAWVLPGAGALAVVFAPALLMIWDTKGERRALRAWMRVCARAGTRWGAFWGHGRHRRTLPGRQAAS